MVSVPVPDPYARHVLARMADYFTDEGRPWPRRLWDIGSVLALEELWEAGYWQAHQVPPRLDTVRTARAPVGHLMRGETGLRHLGLSRRTAGGAGAGGRGAGRGGPPLDGAPGPAAADRLVPANEVGPYSRMTTTVKLTFLAAHPRCAICRRPSVEVDHHHGADIVRGALYHRCNCEVGSVEAALRVPQRLFQSMADDIHRALAGDQLHLARWHRHLDYLGMAPTSYRAGLRKVQDQLTQRYVYWAPVTADGLSNRTEWTKNGPLLDDTEACRMIECVRIRPAPPHLWIYATWEADDGVNSPFPRGLAITRTSSPGAHQALHELRRAQPNRDVS